jgi:hypothetical protein
VRRILSVKGAASPALWFRWNQLTTAEEAASLHSIARHDSDCSTNDAHLVQTPSSSRPSSGSLQEYLGGLDKLGDALFLSGRVHVAEAGADRQAISAVRPEHVDIAAAAALFQVLALRDSP